jgi:hypothetical protein
MKLIRFAVPALIAAALLAGGAGKGLAQKKANVPSFGALSAVEADKAQAEAKAWLKSVGKDDAATLQKFDAIWKQSGRSVLDRLADTFALGDATAAKLLADAANPKAAAPMEVPAIFTDKNASAFFKSNLALAYARQLAQRRVFEQALGVLDTTKAGAVVDPSSYLFHRAVCQHGLLHKEDASQTVDQMISDVIDIPDRYKTVGVLILLDMETWKSKDLGAVARLMDNSGRMLDLARGGPNTQKVQKEIIHRLDELIKELENKAKDQDDKDGDDKEGKPGDGKGGACPNQKPGGSGSGDQPGNLPGKKAGSKPTKPLEQPAPGGAEGKGLVDQIKLKKAIDSWGTLPPNERQQVLQDLTANLSPTDRAIIENYFLKLTQVKGGNR